jgi:hypothetical protein
MLIVSSLAIIRLLLNPTSLNKNLLNREEAKSAKKTFNAQFKSSITILCLPSRPLRLGGKYFFPFCEEVDL